MTFKLPTFNLTVRIKYAAAPAPPLLQEFTSAGALRLYKTAFLTNAVDGFLLAAVLLPKGTPLHDDATGGEYDRLEIPDGSGRWYLLLGWEDVAKGFPNEYRLGALRKVNTPSYWPFPSP